MKRIIYLLGILITIGMYVGLYTTYIYQLKNSKKYAGEIAYTLAKNVMIFLNTERELLNKVNSKNIKFSEFVNYENKLLLENYDGTNDYGLKIIFNNNNKIKIETPKINTYIKNKSLFKEILTDKLTVISFVKIKDPFNENKLYYFIVILLGIFILLSSHIIVVSIKSSEDNMDNLAIINDLVNKNMLVSKVDNLEENTISYANKNFVKYSKAKLKDLIGKNHNVVNSGDYDNSLWEDIYLKLKQGEIATIKTLKNKALDGSFYWIDFVAKQNKRTGEVTRISSNITDIINKNNELNEINNKLIRKNQIMSHLSYSIRHDMRNALLIYLPSSIKVLTKKYPKDTKTINKVFEQIKKYYESVYEFSNLMREDSKIKLIKVDLNKYLNRYLKNSFYYDNIEINLNRKFSVSPAMFSQAIENLVKNGFTYNDNKIKDKKIKIYNIGDDIIIEDNGRGVTNEEFQEYIKPFKRGENKEKGSGLGLIIADEIMKAHNKKLMAKKLKVGTRIIIKKTKTRK